MFCALCFVLVLLEGDRPRAVGLSLSLIGWLLGLFARSLAF